MVDDRLGEAARAAGPPGDPPRYRCNTCGNLTRFDVTVTRRTTAFHHYTVGGELRVEDEQVLDQAVESVVCRWCDSADGVVETRVQV